MSGGDTGGSGGGSMFEEPDFSRAGSPGAPAGGGSDDETASPGPDDMDVPGDEDGNVALADDLEEDDDDLGDELDELNDESEDSVGSLGGVDGDDDGGNEAADEEDDDDFSGELEEAEDAENRLAGGAARAVLQHVARTLVEDPDSLVVEMTEGRSGLRFSVRVAQGDMGRLIGRRGRTAQALRTLVRAAAASEGTDASVDIVD